MFGLYSLSPCMSAFSSPSPSNLNFEAKNVLLNVSISPSAGFYHHWKLVIMNVILMTRPYNAPCVPIWIPEDHFFLIFLCCGFLCWSEITIFVVPCYASPEQISLSLLPFLVILVNYQLLLCSSVVFFNFKTSGVFLFFFNCPKFQSQ